MFNTMKCPRCAETIKANAPTCPFCGLDFSRLPASRGGKGNGLLKFFIGAMVASSTVTAVAVLVTHPHPDDNVAGKADVGAERTPGPSKDPAQVVERNLRVEAALMAGKVLHAAAPEGGQTVVDDARASDDGGSLCVRYHLEDDRGRGKPLERLVYHHQVRMTKSGDWDAYCTKNNIDMIDAVEVATHRS